MGQSETSQDTTPSQLLALEALLSGATVTQAAQAAGVDRRTVTRWKNDPDFRAAMHAAESEARTRVSRKLMDLGATAIDTLAAGMSADAPLPVRMRAADYTLGRLLQLWQKTNFARTIPTTAQILANLERDVDED